MIRDITKHAINLGIRPGQVFEVHIAPDDAINAGEWMVLESCPFARFVNDWRSAEPALDDADPELAYVGIVHDDGIILAPLPEGT